ncbi:WbqC family protein [Kitasatospora sp. NPDC089509]|uniref:WbqC family protein n=1 Tax=Kitasatospora sp. NPDC089509 TaxID=3364079 RepID=UPI003823DA85
MVTAAIHQPHYLPYPGLLDKIARADLVIWLDNAAFARGGWHNRNRIKTGHGPLTLTAPVRRAPLGTPITDVHLATTPWQAKHATTIRQAYAHAPHLDALTPLLDDLYSRPYATLGALNAASCAHLLAAFGIRTPALAASDLGPVGSAKSARLAELCRRAGADTYLAGDGSAAYLDPRAFADAGITLCWQGYRPPAYRQLHGRHGHIDHLSAADLLANTGPGALNTLLARDAGAAT